MKLTTLQSFSLGTILGIALGFVMGFFIRAFFEKRKVKAEGVLAWLLTGIFIVWHVLAGLHLFGIEEPTTVFDVIAGGAVGFVLGERFFAYVTNSIVGALKK